MCNIWSLVKIIDLVYIYAFLIGVCVCECVCMSTCTLLVSLLDLCRWTINSQQNKIYCDRYPIPIFTLFDIRIRYSVSVKPYETSVLKYNSCSPWKHTKRHPVWLCHQDNDNNNNNKSKNTTTHMTVTHCVIT